MITRSLAFTALAATLLLASCASATEPGEVGMVLLEIEYQNYAWKATNYGFYVDGNGDVYRWDRKGVPWELKDSATLSPADFSDKYLPTRTQVSSVPHADLAGLASQIDAAAGGPLSSVKHQCADAGVLTYRAFKLQSNPDRYQVVLLRQEGDVARQNTSAAAQNLISYIRSLKLIDEIAGCDP